MIKIVTEEDVKWFNSKLDELNERTKRHTKQVGALQKEVKDLNKLIKEKQQ